MTPVLANGWPSKNTPYGPAPKEPVCSDTTPPALKCSSHYQTAGPQIITKVRTDFKAPFGYGLLEKGWLLWQKIPGVSSAYLYFFYFFVIMALTLGFQGFFNWDIRHGLKIISVIKKEFCLIGHKEVLWSLLKSCRKDSLESTHLRKILILYRKPFDICPPCP